MDLKFLGKYQRKFLDDGNYHAGQTVEERFSDIEKCILSYSDRYGADNCKKIVDLIDKNIISLSSPQIANLGKEKTGNSVALPASCHNISVGDSIYEIYKSNLEVAMLSKLGAGIGIDFDNVREKGSFVAEGFYSNKKLDWINALVDTSQKVSQNGVRRGFATPYLSIADAEYIDLLKEVSRNNSDKNSVLIDNTIGINIREEFMELLSTKDKDAQKRWVALLNARKETGNVYISFIGNMNKNCQPVYKKLGLEINTSNICTEHLRAAVEGHIPTCVLAALNLNHWDIIKADLDIIRMAIFYLNIVTDEYIKLSEGILGAERARASVIDGRDIGLGTLGFHDILQEKGFAFGDVGSRALNKEIYSTIRKYADLATEELANMHGPCNMAFKADMNVRNASLMMVAPNKTTSFISEMASLGIEPLFSNIFTKKLAKINHVFKNKRLERLLESKGKNTNDVWTLISNSLGSVQNLDFLTKEEKDIFLTFSEISPKDIIDLAADRQVYIDMGQSLNLMNRPNYTTKDMHNIHMYAYEKGIKTLYYFYPQAHATIEQEGKRWDECVSCAD